MAAHRIVIFDANGNALAGADIRSGGPALAAAWIEDTTARLAATGVTDTVAVEFDPDEGGTYAAGRAIECHTLKLELRQRPDGAREFVSLHHTDNRRAQGRGHRILHSTVPGLPAPATLRNRGQSLAELAAQHRAHNPRAWGIR